MSETAREDTSREARPERPTVAIIMRSKDEQPHAERAVAALARQTWKDYVLWNVDSGSTDGTLEVIEPHVQPERRVRIAPEDYVPGPVLNSMVARTSEPIVVFLNADAVALDERWLERLLEPILAGEADATMSRQVARPEAPWIVRDDYDRAYDPRHVGPDSDFFSAAACAFRRELWEQTRFYEGGYAEDLAWSRACRAKGARFRLVADSAVEHSHHYTIRQLFRKRYRHGVAFVWIFGQRANAPRELVRCLKEMARDTLRAITHGKPHLIPYDLVYRATIHLGYDLGRREGARRWPERLGRGAPPPEVESPPARTEASAPDTPGAAG